MRALKRRRQSGERGAAVIEFAVVFSLLLVIALGAFEYGMAFRDWLSVTVAAREGGRVSASASSFGQADCVILEAAAGALQSLQSGELEEVHIYRSNSSGSYPGPNSSFTRRYSPFSSGDPNLVACASSNWNAEHLGSDWEPSDRDNTGNNADWSGVRVVFSRDWLTNFLWFNGSNTYADDAIFRMEPPAP